ncbi:hypothetical protein EMCRGX_G011996 [Ephydatia muelleri]
MTETKKNEFNDTKSYELGGDGSNGCILPTGIMIRCFFILSSSRHKELSNLPYTRDVSVLPRGVHTVTVSATGTNGVSSISVLSFDNTGVLVPTVSLNCIAAGSAPIDRVLVVNCTSSAPLSYATCAVDGEIPLPCVFPHVKNVISLPSGVHVVAVSAIGTNRPSSVAMVKFNVAGDMPITLPVDNFSEGIHSLDITVNATNKAATVSVRFMVNTDGSAVLLKP